MVREKCTLIATLPSFFNKKAFQKVMDSKEVSEVRINTGAMIPYSPEVFLEQLVQMSSKHNKRLWVDIKGRQLRITKWAVPMFDCIELNHDISLKPNLTYTMYLRGAEEVTIAHVSDGNKLFVSPTPREAVGAGQSVNIIPTPQINGYLTEEDTAYLEACKKLDIKDIMASFVDSPSDSEDILKILPGANIIQKIESEEGIRYIIRERPKGLMAARDDLYIQLKRNPIHMKGALKAIINVDPSAICASRIFSSLEVTRGRKVEFADFADLEFMYDMGYRTFMLCDNITNYYFEQAIEAWRCFYDN